MVSKDNIPEWDIPDWLSSFVIGIVVGLVVAWLSTAPLSPLTENDAKVVHHHMDEDGNYYVNVANTGDNALRNLTVLFMSTSLGPGGDVKSPAQTRKIPYLPKEGVLEFRFEPRPRVTQDEVPGLRITQLNGTARKEFCRGLEIGETRYLNESNGILRVERLQVEQTTIHPTLHAIDVTQFGKTETFHIVKFQFPEEPIQKNRTLVNSTPIRPKIARTEPFGFCDINGKFPSYLATTTTYINGTRVIDPQWSEEDQ